MPFHHKIDRALRRNPVARAAGTAPPKTTTAPPAPPPQPPPQPTAPRSQIAQPRSSTPGAQPAPISEPIPQPQSVEQVEQLHELERGFFSRVVDPSTYSGAVVGVKDVSQDAVFRAFGQRGSAAGETAVRPEIRERAAQIGVVAEVIPLGGGVFRLFRGGRYIYQVVRGGTVIEFPTRAAAKAFALRSGRDIGIETGADVGFSAAATFIPEQPFGTLSDVFSVEGILTEVGKGTGEVLGTDPALKAVTRRDVDQTAFDRATIRPLRAGLSGAAADFAVDQNPLSAGSALVTGAALEPVFRRVGARAPTPTLDLDPTLDPTATESSATVIDADYRIVNGGSPAPDPTLETSIAPFETSISPTLDQSASPALRQSLSPSPSPLVPAADVSLTPSLGGGITPSPVTGPPSLSPTPGSPSPTPGSPSISPTLSPTPTFSPTPSPGLGLAFGGGDDDGRGIIGGRAEGEYPRVIRHTEIAVVTSDLDRFRSTVNPVYTSRPVILVRDDSEPVPVARRISNTVMSPRGRRVETRPAPKYNKKTRRAFRRRQSQPSLYPSGR